MNFLMDLLILMLLKMQRQNYNIIVLFICKWSRIKQNITNHIAEFQDDYKVIDDAAIFSTEITN